MTKLTSTTQTSFAGSSRRAGAEAAAAKATGTWRVSKSLAMWCLFVVLQQMQELAAADIKLSVSYCNVCYSGSSCDQSYYIHWGDNKLGSCNDSSAPLDDDYKSAYGNVNTPHGAGPYTLINGNAAVDQVMSRITARDGSVYTCYKANGRTFTTYCGATFACSVGLSCYGPA